MTFAKLCREANKKQRRNAKDVRLESLRKLLDDDVSLERAWHELNAERLRGRAAESSVEALMFSLRSGVSALKRPDTLRRLSELSEAQLREVAVRLQKFKPEIAPAWTIEDVKIVVGVRNRLHGKDAGTGRR
jgi:hypothetical protein